MKKINIFFLGISLLLSACSGSPEDKSFTSGTPMTEGINTGSFPNLNFRVNQEAIDANYSFMLLGQLKSWQEDEVPSSWPEVKLEKLREYFLYLHKQKTSAEITRLLQTSDSGNVKLVFQQEREEDFVLYTNKDVSLVNFKDVNLIKRDENNWSIVIDGEELFWKVREQKLCLQDHCVDV